MILVAGSVLGLPGIKLESNNNMGEPGALGLVTKIKTEEGEYADYDKDGGDSLHPPDADKLEQENRSPDGAGESNSQIVQDVQQIVNT